MKLGLDRVYLEKYDDIMREYGEKLKGFNVTKTPKGNAEIELKTVEDVFTLSSALEKTLIFDNHRYFTDEGYKNAVIIHDDYLY